ncbi:hypothetical protein ACR6C2_27000 [Streptomyces sp. INA 01156]
MRAHGRRIGPLEHADGTCAAAGTGSAYTPPAPGAVLDVPTASSPLRRPPARPGRAGPARPLRAATSADIERPARHPMCPVMTGDRCRAFARPTSVPPRAATGACEGVAPP